MNIIFEKLEMLNFMSFKEESFDFSINHGMNLICGTNNDVPNSKNGAGKTCILNALVFCLFGKTINDISKEHITNRLASDKDKCETSINIVVDGIKYRIIRGLSGKARNKYCELYKYNNETDKFDDITKSGIKDTQKFIEKEIIKCNMQLFLRSILLTSDQSYNFFNLKKEQKCEFIEQIFDLLIFGVMYDSIHKDVLKLDKEIYALNREYKAFEDQFNDTVLKSEQYDKQLIEKKNKIRNILDQLRNDLLNLTKNTENFSDILEKLDIENKSNKVKIEKLNIKRDEIMENYHKIDKEISTLKLRSSQNLQIINKHKSALELICKECFKKFDDFYKISDLKKESENFVKNAADLEIEKNNIYAAYNKFRGVIKTLVNRETEIENESYSIKRKNIDKEKKITSLNTDISNNEFLLTKIDNEKNPYIDSTENLKTKIDEISKKISELDNDATHLKYIEKLVSPDMIRKLIIKDLIEYLNNRIHFYICRMGAKFTCIFDENLYYRFYTDSGETSYDNFSSGEKMRLSIATSFAFRDFMSIRSCINSNIVILDEYLDSNLDSSSITNLMSILKEFSIVNHYDVYIVSHRKEISDTFFNNIITVVKTDGISKINKENSERGI